MGNGTDATPDRYDELFTSSSKLGFIVIDSYSKTTGTGKEIVEAIDYLKNENEQANSLFYQKYKWNVLVQLDTLKGLQELLMHIPTTKVDR